MALSVNVTVNMPPEMVENIDQQKPSDMSRAEFIRRCIRNDTDHQLDVTETRLEEAIDA